MMRKRNLSAPHRALAAVVSVLLLGTYVHGSSAEETENTDTPPSAASAVPAPDAPAPAAGAEALADLLSMNLRSPIQSNESAAIGNLRTIVGAETSFYAANNRYGSLKMLTHGQPASYLLWEITGGNSTTLEGYVFKLYLSATCTNFVATAEPLEPGVTGNRCFIVDASGVIRSSDSINTLSLESAPIGQA